MYKNTNTLLILIAVLIVCYIFYNVYILENFDMPEFKMPEFKMPEFLKSKSSENNTNNTIATECDKKLKDDFLKKQKADQDNFYKKNPKCSDNDSKK